MENPTAAVFLAGGKGSRIAAVTSENSLPKQLLPVGSVSSLEHGLTVVGQLFLNTDLIIVSSPASAKTFATKFPAYRHVLQPVASGNAEALMFAIDATGITEESLLALNADHLFGLTANDLLQLAGRHKISGNDATVLLQTCPNQNIRFRWLYDDSLYLCGRSEITEEQDPKSQKSGVFIELFMAKIDWLRQALPIEINSATQQRRENKTTEMLLSGVKGRRVGISPTETVYYGINTTEDLLALRAYA